ncbi:MAG: TIGR03086 family metal-binding protein [Actinomycetota bacterium]
MTNDLTENPTERLTAEELPIFPATPPPVFADRARTVDLIRPTLTALADVVQVTDDQLDDPTPCDGFTVEQLQNHVLGWLQFFADALADPDGHGARIDTETRHLATGDNPAEIVTAATDRIVDAVQAGVADRLVVMAQARMTGDCVLAMALGEYLVHGWDLASAPVRRWPDATDRVDGEAATAALAFLESTVAPECRGPDSGFFGYEVPVPDGAGLFTRLLCFTGRDPHWAPSS